MPQTLYLLFFAANLVFIATHLYGWLLKWYYKPKAYSEDFHALFPATRAVGTIYLLQLLELPYLMQTGLAAMGCGLTNTATNAAMPTMATDTAMGGLFADALFFANAFALLVFAVQMLVMCELYFFPRRRRPTRDYWLSGPARHRGAAAAAAPGRWACRAAPGLALVGHHCRRGGGRVVLLA